jgi:O-acetyl-ADP-ribose deacetylase (regulator of RNase III)
MKLRLGPTAISIERGDITDAEVDAVVNAASSTLAMSTGVAAAIKRKGGVIIEEEAMRQGPVDIGDVVLTTGGNLAATHIVHAAVMSPDAKPDGDTITRATRAILSLADKHRLTSLALPALGTGVGHVAPTVAADAMIDTVVAHVKTGSSSLRKIVFVLYEDAAYKAFSETLKRHGGSR